MPDLGAVFHYFIIFLLIVLSSFTWHVMLKGKGVVDNLWLFAMMLMLIFNVTTSAISYFPYVTGYFFTGTVLFQLFAALYIYSFPSSVWPNYAWAVILGLIAAVAKTLHAGYSEALYVPYFFLAFSFAVVYFAIIFRKVKYLKMNRKAPVIMYTSYISSVAVLLSVFSAVSIFLYSSFFFNLFLAVVLPFSVVLLILSVYMNVNTQTGINTSNVLLFLLFSLPFTAFTLRLFLFRAIITKYLGTPHFFSGALTLLFLLICIAGILISLVVTVIEGFINRSRDMYQKLLTKYRTEASTATSYDDLFKLFDSTLRNEFPDIKSAVYVLISEDYDTGGFLKDGFVKGIADRSGFVKESGYLNNTYFTKNHIDLPPEIIYLSEKYGGDVFIPVFFKSEIAGFFILVTRKISHNALTCIYSMANITVNMFEKISLFQAVIETEKKLEASRHFRETGKMVSFIAHELRSPLSSVMFNMEVIKDNILKNRSLDPEYIDISLKEIKRLNDIVEKMLTYGRNIKLTPVPGTAASFFDELSYLYQGQEVAVNFIDRTEEQTFSFDWDALKSVMINLITNSIQAFERIEKKGSVKITGWVHKNNLVLEVCDDGPGILPEHKDSIFEPFYTTRKDGNGLGLATCEKIAKLSGGKVVLRSTSEKGTVFQVVLPVDQT